MTKETTLEITCAADEMIERYGTRAALEAASWANSAYDRGEIEKYEFWQMVVMDLNERDYQRHRAKRRSH
jgi:hypothetical protein